MGIEDLTGQAKEGICISLEDIKQREEDTFRKLQKHSKQLHELLITEYFRIASVHSKRHETSFTPHSEIVFGGRSPQYKGGYIQMLRLGVMPDKQENPIQTLYFQGDSPLRANDYICAKIPVYAQQKFNSIFFSGNDQVFYFERPVKPEEFAVEIAILSDEKSIIRVDRAANAELFFKDEDFFG